MASGVPQATQNGADRMASGPRRCFPRTPEERGGEA